MIDLIDAKVRALVERRASRKEIRDELDGTAGETLARRFARGKKAQRHRAQEQRAIVERIHGEIVVSKGPLTDWVSDTENIKHLMLDEELDQGRDRQRTEQWLWARFNR